MQEATVDVLLKCVYIFLIHKCTFEGLLFSQSLLRYTMYIVYYSMSSTHRIYSVVEYAMA